MIENDARTSHNGIKLGDRVDFRWNATWHQGTVIRLTSTKAVISTGKETGHTVSYRQIGQSTRYAD
jgi:hypothetical protein